MRWRLSALLLAVIFFSGSLAVAQQQYGTLTGTVKDEQGGVLPGATVTISSPALIGGAQTDTTGEGGNYTFRNLPAGTYSVKFEMAGFAVFNREGIVISVATATTVDATLKVGAIEETITVTGDSPVVDVKTTISQTNIEEEIFEAVPTGRNPWVMAGLVPGMVTGALDVGGNAGMQQYNLEIFGSSDSQKSFSIDGLKTNWPGGGGGYTMQYYDFAMYEEYNFQTSAGTAESDVAGVYMNMVTKSGGNELSGTQSAYFMNDALQADNMDDELRRKMGLSPDAPGGIGGNPIDVAYDLNGSLGGPIVKDKVWFFGSGRWWRHNDFIAGVLNPDGSPVLNDNRITNIMGKVTWQVDDASRFFLMMNKNWKYRWHRNDLTMVDFPTTIATNIQPQPAQNYVLSFNRVLGTAAVLDVRFGRMWGETPYVYQPEIDQNSIRSIHWYDTGTGIADRSGFYHSWNPNHRYQFNTNVSYYSDQWAGTHDFKFGLQIGRDKMEYHVRRIFDTHLVAIDGVANEAVLWNTPVDTDSRINDYGLFAQDAWTIGQKATLNIGLRVDGINAYIPEQSSPAGTWIGPRQYAEVKDTPNWGPNVAPRIGLSYDIFGDGKTAIKAYYGRFYIQMGSLIADMVNPAYDLNVNVPWNDLDGDLYLAPGPSGGVADSPELDLTRLYQEGFKGGVQTTINPDLKRPYTDNFDIGIQHELMPNFSIAVGYHRRQHREGIGRPDRNRPESAYTPVQVDYVDPVDGPKTITAYNIKPEYLGARDLFLTNVPQAQSSYNGLEITARKRYSNNWQLLAGFVWGDHKGFDYSQDYVDSNDFNNPNFTLNRDNGSVWLDLKWSFKLSGSYQLPYGIDLSGKWEARDGIPIRRRLAVSGLNQGTETIYAAQRGVDRTETVRAFIDVALSKTFKVGRSGIEPLVQMFNLFNTNPVINQRDMIGSSWARPSRILSPRIVRFGIKWTF